MASTVASRKAKGRRLQQWICKKISDLTGYAVGPDEMIASREMGQSGTDVRLIGPARTDFPFAVEAKNQESWSIHSWIKQAKDNMEKDMVWLLIAKRNHDAPVIVIDAEEFFNMLDQVDGAYKPLERK